VPFLSHVRPDHDETLVARLAADDLVSAEVEVVRAQVAECPACAELLADLLSIAAATARLPGPQRTRDFRLTEADAARLRPAGWRGLLARLGSPSFAFVKPLAGGLAALGVAGLILASLPSTFMSSSAGSNPNTLSDSAAGGGAPSHAAPAPAFGQASPGDGRTSVPLTVPEASGGLGVATEGGPKSGSGAPEAAALPSPTDEGAPADLFYARDRLAGAESPSPLLVLSVILLAAGIVLGGLRLIGRRLA
jgi:hypothetical protein